MFTNCRPAYLSADWRAWIRAVLIAAEGTTEDGQEFFRFVSIHSGSSALAYFRVSCTAECIDLLRVKIFRCDAKGLPLGRPLVTWEKPGR